MKYPADFAESRRLFLVKNRIINNLRISAKSAGETKYISRYILP